VIQYLGGEGFIHSLALLSRQCGALASRHDIAHLPEVKTTFINSFQMMAKRFILTNFVGRTRCSNATLEYALTAEIRQNIYFLSLFSSKKWE
jgi:hypothetical protein